MSSDYCKALTRASGESERCKNKAKYGEFCKIHKEVDKNICQGITKCGETCHNPVKRGQLCNRHVLQEQPDHDWFELSLYVPDVHWPDMVTVLRDVKKVKTGKDLAVHIKRYEQYHVRATFFVSGVDLTNEPQFQQIIYNRYIIFLMESFFVNYYLDFSAEHWKKIIEEIVYAIKNKPFLKNYGELFRKKFDTTYRQQTQNKYNCKILEKALGTDLAQKIVCYL